MPITAGDLAISDELILSSVPLLVLEQKCMQKYKMNASVRTLSKFCLLSICSPSLKCSHIYIP
jgi:hypothetical protein